MSYQIIGIAVLAVIVALIKLLSTTDVPKIKGIPEIPGVPIFGNLIQLGTDHARVTAKWAKKYGPVFQTRLGNKVWLPQKRHCFGDLTCAPENHLCQLL